jgi:hypothetical protein
MAMVRVSCRSWEILRQPLGNRDPISTLTAFYNTHQRQNRPRKSKDSCNRPPENTLVILRSHAGKRNVCQDPQAGDTGISSAIEVIAVNLNKCGKEQNTNDATQQENCLLEHSYSFLRQASIPKLIREFPA